jgi:hypothetical protein
MLMCAKEIVRVAGVSNRQIGNVKTILQLDTAVQCILLCQLV